MRNCFILQIIVFMISLKDEIKRFQKMVYNKQLGEFVTVDQMFVGGGITIESMIHENNFIVEELKKMNAVFLNYCKLNEKVYNKIIEHELNLHSEQGRLNSLTNSLDRKIDDMTKSMKELHQSTIEENIRSINLIDSVTVPLKQELEKKVDRFAFEAQMKKILEEYDEGVHDKEVTHDVDDKLSNGSSSAGGMFGLNSQGLPVVRKKGKVGYDDFYKLQGQIHNRMKASDSRLQAAAGQAAEGKDLILKYLPIINKSSSELSLHTTQIYKINHDIQEQQNHFNIVTNKLLSELNHKTNDQYWNTKLDTFYDKHIRPVVMTIEESIKNNSRQFKAQVEANKVRFASIDEDSLKTKNNIRNIQNLLKQHSAEIEHIKEEIRINHEQFYQEKISNDRALQKLKLDMAKKIEGVEKSLTTQIDQVKNLIQNLVHSIQESVLRAVNKRVEAQMRGIEAEIKTNKQKIKGLKSDVTTICQDIKNVKDILSKKANFTDIVHQVEKKADREDFKELESKMQENSQQFVSKNLNESISISRAERQPQRVRASSLSRANKTLFAPRSATNRVNRDMDTGTKLFMCGIDGQYGESKGLLHQTSRRKSIKSSAAVISDFIL